MNIKVFFICTFSQWIEFNYIGLHWIVTDALEKKILILVIHSVVTQEVPSMPLLLSWLRTMQWFCVTPVSKRGQLPLPSRLKYHIPVIKVFYNMPSVHHSDTSFSTNLR